MKTKGFPNISLHHVRAEQCNRKLSFFVKEFWNVIIHDDLVWNWHMEALCNEIQAASERVFKRLPKLHDIIVNIPPGTSKTTIISVMGTAWDFSRAPWIREFVGSYSDSAVMGISDNIRLIMRSEKYRTYFPKTIIRRDKDAGHNFKTTENGEFYAFTVGGTLTSKHADILKIDDPLNPKQAASAAELLKTNDFFDKRFSQVLMSDLRSRFGTISCVSSSLRSIKPNYVKINETLFLCGEFFCFCTVFTHFHTLQYNY